MAKVLGTMMTILSTIAIIGIIYLRQNSSNYLPYNEATPASGMGEVGLLLPFVFALFFFIAGVTILRTSTEPEKI